MDNGQLALLVQQLGGPALQQLAANPTVQMLLAQNQPVKPEVQKPVEQSLTEDEVFFLNMFRGFLATDAGNPMAGMAAKFARYVQSETDKSKAL